MGLLSGLEIMGIKLPTRQEEPVEEAPEKVESEPEAETRQEQLEKTEKSLLYEKRYTCPICDKEFTALTVRYSSLNLIGTDDDFRPQYEELENTLDFLVSALSIKLGDVETASELLRKIIANKGIKQRLKDRAKKMIKKVNTIMLA